MGFIKKLIDSRKRKKQEEFEKFKNEYHEHCRFVNGYRRGIFKPLRGSKSTALTSLNGANRLRNGEIFFEIPDSGIGTGHGKIKIGDGFHDYAELPYFLE